MRGAFGLLTQVPKDARAEFHYAWCAQEASALCAKHTRGVIRYALGTKEISPAISLWNLSRLRKGKSSFK